jgi:hypothetical protein
MSDFPQPPRRRRNAFGPAWEITFQSRDELERYLEKQGRRVARWNADGSFDTEGIPDANHGTKP